MTSEAGGPGIYTLFFHVRQAGRGHVGDGQYQVEFTVPVKAEAAYAAVSEAVSEMVGHIAGLIGIPVPMRPVEPMVPVPAPEVPKLEFSPDIEALYQAFKARMWSEAAQESEA